MSSQAITRRRFLESSSKTTGSLAAGAALLSVPQRARAQSPGDQIVLVITASSHRLAAFESAEFLMDYLKTRAPFWKKEHRSDGTSGDWVSAKDHDDHAAARWKQT
jgi:molybdopterin synthase catalytic subunit